MKLSRKDRRSLAAHREINLIDIENVLGTSHFTVRDVERYREFHIASNKVAADAHIVIGVSSQQALLVASYGWPGARVAFLSGRDGADRALMAVALEEHVEDRYEKLVIASGDHCFIQAVQLLQQFGMSVHVFARATCLSAALWASCKNVRTFSSREFALAA